MKTLLSLFKTLIQINLATAFVSLLVFAVMREQQAQLTAHKQDRSDPSQSYHTAIKAKTTAEQVQLETSYERIAQHEQQIKKLEGEVEAYKTQVKDLLIDKNGQVSVSKPTTSPFAENKNLLPAGMPASPGLLNQIVKSGQPNPSAQTLAETTQPSFKLPESSKKINIEKSFNTNPVPKNSSVNSQLQSTIFPSQKVPHTLTPSTSPVASLPTVPGKPSNSEIALDSRALFTAQSPQKPLDSFVTPNKNDGKRESEIRNRAALIAQQISRTVNRDYGYQPVSQSTPEPNEQIRHANDIVAGLMVADEKGQINYGTKTYKKVQTAIRLLRRGEPLEVAARRSTLSSSVLKQLIKWGENRPGNLSELSEISQADPNLK